MICNNETCTNEFIPKVSHQVYCSVSCRKDQEKIKYAPLRSAPLANVSTKGARSEMIATVDLLEKGYEVFSAVSPSASCDLIILVNGETKRVQVKTVPLAASSGTVTATPGAMSREAERADIFCWVYDRNRLLYTDPLGVEVIL